MAQPPAFNRSENYTEYAAAHPGATFPPASLDGEMDDIETTLDATLSNLAIIQRDDGKLANASVHPDALSAATKALMAAWNPRGVWATATAYAVRDVVEQAGISYVCAIAHTSAASFATDTAAGRWINLGTGLPTATNIAFTPAGGIAASNVQAAIQELDTEKANLASPTFTGNPTAPTPSPGDNDTSIATTAFVAGALAAISASVAAAAPLASPALTGNPTAPTPAAGDSDTSLATTGFVAGAIQPTFSYVFNGDCRLFGGGASAPPSGWTLAGSGATAARNTTTGQFRWGAAGVNLTRAGANAALFQTVSNNPAFGPGTSWAGKTVTVGAWVRCATADRARVYVSDGVDTYFSGVHPGGSTMVFLTRTVTLSAFATSLSVGCSVSDGDAMATFSGMTLVLGSYLQDSVHSYGARKCIIPFHLHAGATFANGTTAFFHSAGADNAEANASVPIPFRGVARNLYCVSGGSTGASGSFVYTLRRSGADTALTATISGIGVTNAADTTNQVEYSANQQMCLRVVASGGTATVGGMGAYLEYEEVPL